MGSNFRIPGLFIYMCRWALKNEVYNNSCYSYSILSKILFIAKIPSQLNFSLQSGYFAERIRRVLLMQTLITTLLRNLMLTVPKAAWVTCAKMWTRWNFWCHERQFEFSDLSSDSPYLEAVALDLGNRDFLCHGTRSVSAKMIRLIAIVFHIYNLVSSAVPRKMAKEHSCTSSDRISWLKPTRIRMRKHRQRF